MVRTLVIFSLITTACQASELEVRLLDVARPVGSIVRVADVAQLLGVGPDEQDRIGRLPLMPAPAPGTTQHLSATVLRELLAAQGVVAEAGQFSGVERTAISTRDFASAPSSEQWRPSTQRERQPAPRLAPTRRDSAGYLLPRDTQPFTSQTQARLSAKDIREVDERVAAAIQQQVRAFYSEVLLAVKQVKLSQSAVRELHRLRDESLQVRADSVADLDVGEATFSVWTETLGQKRSFRVVAELVEQRMRVVTREPIDRGGLITASSLKLEPEPINETPVEGVYRSIEEAVGKETTRRIGAEQPLTSNNTIGRKLVRRGETVEVISGGGGIRVRLTAIAKDDGRMGDLVTVEPSDRKQPFDARVVGPGRLAVLGAGALGDRLSRVVQPGGLQ